jgi:3-dehydroquinate synthase
MKNIIPVNFADGKSYMIDIENGFDILKNYISSDKRYFVVTDSNVFNIYFKKLNSLVFDDRADVFVFRAGESSKIYETVHGCYTELLAKGHDRSSVLVALGGGVAGDLCGFAASTYMRGVDCIQIPTSLLAMVDSSSGGKTGYDLQGTKNIIGTFYQPRLVYIDMSCIGTLPEKEFSTGMAECIKHGLIADKSYFTFIENHKQEIRDHDIKVLTKLVRISCEIKADIVGNDELETGARQLLNFGHTIGHAVEAASGYSISHGEAVSVGINAALSVSNLKSDEKDRVRSLLQFFSLPLKYKGCKNDIVKHMTSDKKFKNGAFSYIILNKLGKAHRIVLKSFDAVIDILDSVLEI